MQNTSYAHTAVGPRSAFDWRPFLGWTLLGLLGLLCWDQWGQDLALARLFGTEAGFPLRQHWFYAKVMHEGARWAAWGWWLALAWGVTRPWGLLRSLTPGERRQLVGSTLLALALVSLAKFVSNTSCPWELQAFGGETPYVPHWMVGLSDGGSGRCFPAGHASTGFAFLGGFFALRRQHARWARHWLVGALLAGFALGWAQQARGAHFMSHTLWTAWLCWTSGWLYDLTGQAWRSLRSPSLRSAAVIPLR